MSCINKTLFVCQIAIECGRVPTIFKGEVIYLNSTTYLNSQLEYSCSSGYKLIGSKTRVCNEESRWSGSSPKCEGILYFSLFNVLKNDLFY